MEGTANNPFIRAHSRCEAIAGLGSCLASTASKSGPFIRGVRCNSVCGYGCIYAKQ